MIKSKIGLGLGQRSVALLVLFLAVSGVLFWFAPNLLHAASGIVDVKECELSVRTASYKYVLGIPFFNYEIFDNPFQLQGCATNNLKVSEEKITDFDDNKIVSLSSDFDTKRDRLKKLVMDEMADCWLRYGKAGARVWDVEIEGREIDEEETFCLVCSEIVIDKEFQSMELNNMYSYAGSELSGRTGTYTEYLLDDFKQPSYGSDQSIIFDGSSGHHNQYSIVFAVKEMDNIGMFDYFKGLPADNSGIINCRLLLTELNENTGALEGTSTKQVTGDLAKAVGCDTNGNFIGLLFGRVLSGRSDRDFGFTKKFKFLKTERRYPATVRLLPTKDVFDDLQCKRIY